MKNKLLSFLCLIIFAFVSACNTQKEEQLHLPPNTSSLDAQHQFLDFEIFYPTHKLENWLNTKINGIIVDKIIPKENEKDSVRIIIQRTHKIAIAIKGDSVDVLFPLNVEIIADKYKKSGKVKKRRIEGTLNLYLNIKPTIDQDWNIVSKTILKDHHWVKEPKLQLGNTNIGIKFLTNHILKNEINKVTLTLDEILKEKVDLKKAISKTWINIQKPLPIIKSDTLDIYFKIDPKQIYGDINFNKKGFVFKLSVETRTLVNLHKDSLINIRPLPAFHALKTFQPDSNKLDLLANLPLDYLNHHLSEMSKNYSYNKTLVEFKINNIQLTGSGNDILLEINVDGTAKGKVNLKGKPFYHPKKQTLTIEDLNYSIETDNVFLNHLDKNFKEDLIAYFNKNAKIDLSEYMGSLPNYLNESINQGRTAEKFTIIFDEIQIKNLIYTVNATHLQILMKSTPKFSLELADLPVKKRMLIK